MGGCCIIGYQLFHILTLDQINMKFAVALPFLAALAEANPWGYWGYPYRGIKLGPKHEWVEGYGYAIPQVKPAEERKKREAEAAVLGTTHSSFFDSFSSPLTFFG